MRTEWEEKSDAKRGPRGELAKEPCGGFLVRPGGASSESRSGALLSASSTQSKRDLRLRAPASKKRCLCATTRQSRSIKPANSHKCSGLNLPLSSSTRGWQCFTRVRALEKWTQEAASSFFFQRSEKCKFSKRSVGFKRQTNLTISFKIKQIRPIRGKNSKIRLISRSNFCKFPF